MKSKIPDVLVCLLCLLISSSYIYNKTEKEGNKGAWSSLGKFLETFSFSVLQSASFYKRTTLWSTEKKKKKQKLMSKPGVCNFKFQVILIPGLLDYLPQPTYWSLLSLQLMGSSPSTTACLSPFVYIIVVRLNYCPKSLFNLYIEQHRKVDNFPSEWNIMIILCSYKLRDFCIFF